MGVATEDYLLSVGGWDKASYPPLTIDNPPWLRPCMQNTFDIHVCTDVPIGIITVSEFAQIVQRGGLGVG